MTLHDLAARVGEPIGTSEWLAIDQDRINAFADTTEDHQFIHVDPEKAQATPMGTTVAHGFLTLSLLSQLIGTAGIRPQVSMSINYGFDKVRFLNFVKSGSRIRGHFKLLQLEQKRPGQWLQKVEATVEIDGETKPALIAEWLFQHNE